MARFGVIVAAAAAVLALSGGNALAACLADAACVAPTRSQVIVVPPLFEQQIETASSPFAMPAASDAEDDDLGPPAVLDILDSGFQDWLVIAPDKGFDRLPATPETEVAKIVPERRRHPLPQATEKPIGAYLSIAVPVVVRSMDIPGIDDSTSGRGNRGLWFSGERAPGVARNGDDLTAVR